MRVLVITLVLGLVVTACSKIDRVEVRPPTVNSQVEPYSVDAGTIPSGEICASEDAVEGQCG